MVGITYNSDLVVLALGSSHLDDISEATGVGTGIIRAQVWVATLDTHVKDLLVGSYVASCCSIHYSCLSYRESK